MRTKVLSRTLPIPVLLAVAFWFVFWATIPGKTWVQLTDGNTGRRIISAILKDGDTITLTWKNSLFRLMVTEIFSVKGGLLIQNSVTFAEPGGREPPIVKKEDLDDLYHTGGSFRAEGLSKLFSRVIFRVGEIGNPTLKIGSHSVNLAQEVGFGGSVILEARKSTRYAAWQR